mmetsp:Transcript_2215/g.5528  ORF Transcript_2215/g.5528 Transcript_2215/m.5528 type:complete len:111 (-) Transcript_2215:265-597(-)
MDEEVSSLGSLKLKDLTNHDWGVTPHKSPRVVITNAHEKAVVIRGRRLNEIATSADTKTSQHIDMEFLKRLEAKWVQAAEQLAEIDNVDEVLHQQVKADLAAWQSAVPAI